MPLEVSRSSQPTLPPRFSLHRTVGGMRLNNISNRSIPHSAVCQASGTPGIYNRAANAHAMSIAVDLMKVTRETLSGSERAAMDKSLRLLSPNSPERFGNNVLVHLTTLGAMHAGITSMLNSSPDNESPQAASLRLNLARVEKAIVDIGIKAGKCRTVADGGYHGDERSWQLTEKLKAGREAILACINDGEGRQILERIADELLAEPMRNSILERQGRENWEAFRDGTCNPMEAVQKQMADDLERGLQRQLDSGGAYDFMSAILELMKLPEYVVQRDPGRHAPPGPDRPADGDPPPPRLPPELRDAMARGGPIAYNHNNVPVHNHVPVNVDLSGLANHINGGHAAPQLLNVENLVTQLRKDNYQLGLAHGRLEAERRMNELLLRENDGLRARLLETEARLEQFASRNGGDRVIRNVEPERDRTRGDNELRLTRNNNRDVVPPPPNNRRDPVPLQRMADILTVPYETTENIPQVPFHEVVISDITADDDERLAPPDPRLHQRSDAPTITQDVDDAELLNLYGHYQGLGPDNLSSLASLANYHGTQREAPGRNLNVIGFRMPEGVQLRPAGRLPPHSATGPAPSAAALLGGGMASQPPVGSRRADLGRAQSNTRPPVPPRVRNPLSAFDQSRNLQVTTAITGDGIMHGQDVSTPFTPIPFPPLETVTPIVHESMDPQLASKYDPEKASVIRDFLRTDSFYSDTGISDAGSDSSGYAFEQLKRQRVAADRARHHAFRRGNVDAIQHGSHADAKESNGGAAAVGTTAIGPRPAGQRNTGSLATARLLDMLAAQRKPNASSSPAGPESTVALPFRQFGPMVPVQ